MRFRNPFRRESIAGALLFMALCVAGCKPEAAPQGATGTGGNPPTALTVPMGSGPPAIVHPDPTLADGLNDLNAEVSALPQTTPAVPDPEIAELFD